MIERLVTFADLEGPGYGAAAIGPGGAAAGVVGGSELTPLESASSSRGDDTLSIESEAGKVVMGLSAQTSPIGFETPTGLNVGLQILRFSTEGPGPDDGFDASGIGWSFGGETDGIASLRTAWFLLKDASAFFLFAVRPEGASDHAAEQVGAARIRKDGELTAYGEPLLSTEYDSAGSHTRATLELWPDDPETIAERGAGQQVVGASAEGAGGELHAARFTWAMGGVPGIGGYEIFNAGS